MKKFLCMIMAISLLCLNTLCFATSVNENSTTVSPRYIAIIQTALNLERKSSNKVSCFADNIVDYGKVAKVKVELQKKDGGWSTIETWEDTYKNYACIEKDWYVESSYKYRLKVTFEAYAENMVLIESDIQYSPEV